MFGLLSTFFLVGLCCSNVTINTLDYKQADNESSQIVFNDNTLPKYAFSNAYNFYLSLAELGSINEYFTSFSQQTNALGTGLTGQYILDNVGEYSLSPSLYSSGMCAFYYLDIQESFLLRPYDCTINYIKFITRNVNELYSWRFNVSISNDTFNIDIDMYRATTSSNGIQQFSWSSNALIYDGAYNVRIEYESLLSTFYLYVNLNVWGGIFDDLGNDYQAGYSTGYAGGYAEGLTKGRDETQTEAYDNGYNNGYQVGYDSGLAYALEQGSTASTIFTGIIDVGLLPINVFLAMLNFEVFGINISGLVSSFLTISIVIIIIRFILGAKNGK